MDHVAIDLGGSHSQICVRSASGAILEEHQCSTAKLGRYLERRPNSRVILETCAEAFQIADLALEHGHEVRVIPSSLVRSLGVGARRMKTDRRDAQVLSEVSCRIELPSVHVPSARSRELKSVCGSREVLVGARTKLINHVRGFLRTRAIRLRTGGPGTLPTRVRSKLLQSADGIPVHVERLLVVIEELNAQIRQADRELELIARHDDVCRRMMSVPGVGPVTAVRFRAALDIQHRFEGSHSVQSYLGLTPGEHSSSTRQHRTGITKAGAPRVRWSLIQAAWCAMRTRPHDPMVQWAQQIAERRGRTIAVVALARKMAGILFAIWRDGSAYDPPRGAQHIPE